MPKFIADSTAIGDVSPEPITHEIIEIVQQPRTPCLRASTMWIVRLVGSVAIWN
jgi:hypothetical protein